MSSILRRNREVAIQYNFILYLYRTLVWQINKIEYERGGGNEHLIQNKLEMYRNLKGMQSTSRVKKRYN